MTVHMENFDLAIHMEKFVSLKLIILHHPLKFLVFFYYVFLSIVLLT